MKTALYYGNTPPKPPYVIGGGGGGDGDEKVKVSGTDSTAEYLEDKIQAGTNTVFDKQIISGVEKLVISSVGDTQRMICEFEFSQAGHPNWNIGYIVGIRETGGDAGRYRLMSGSQTRRAIGVISKIIDDYHCEVITHGEVTVPFFAVSGMTFPITKGSVIAVHPGSGMLYKDPSGQMSPYSCGILMEEITVPVATAKVYFNHAIAFDEVGGGVSDNDKVKTSATDATTDYLEQKLTAGANISIVKHDNSGVETLEIISTAAESFSDFALLSGANVFNCNQISGFTDKFSAIKVTAVGSGIVNKLSIYVFNTYGARKIQLGIYDLAGSLIQKSAIEVLPSQQNKTVVLSIPNVTVISGNQYWLGVWAEGVDIPTFKSFSPYNSTFPSGMHAINHTSLTGGVPNTFNSSYSFDMTDLTIPITAFK